MMEEKSEVHGMKWTPIHTRFGETYVLALQGIFLSRDDSILSLLYSMVKEN
jgi:hypothetical protein